MSVRIIIDSTTDVSPAYQNRVRVVPLTIRFGDTELIDGVTVSRQRFYEMLVESDELPTTSQASPAAFEREYASAAQAGDSAVVLTISAQLSGTHQSACIAAQDFENVVVVDSQSATIGAGILAQYAVDCAERGMPAAEIAARLEEKRDDVCVIALLDTLEYLKRGGRCSALVAMSANLLHLKPCIEVKDGKMGVGRKYRGKLEKCYVQYIEDRLKGRDDIDCHRIFITDSGIDEATWKELERVVRACQPFEEVLHTQAGCTVSNHCGPGCMGILYYHK